MVSNRRSTMHSDETLVLNSKTLEIAWHRDILRHQQPRTELTATRPRGCGGWITAHADFDRDGLDEIVNLWPSEYWVIRGDNGQQYADETLGPTPIDGIGNLYLICAYPLICDIDNDGQLETICCHRDMVLAFGHHTGRPSILWHTDRDDGAAGIPAVGDVNHDGMLELGLPGCRDGFRCLHATTGKVLWTVPRRSRGDSFSNCACADIDNDGRREFVYADGSVLLAVGAPKARADPILWQIDVGANVEVIAVADADGDGFCEILVACEDGNLYCISQ